MLLIDGNHKEAYLLRQQLAGAFALEYADRLSVGLERLSRGGIDVLLLDPSVSDGRSHDSLLWEHARAAGLPVIVLTTGEEAAAKARQQGACDSLVKWDIDEAKLARAIRRAAARKKPAATAREPKPRRHEMPGAHLQNIVKHLPDAVIVVDKGGIVRFANPAVGALFGCKTEQLLGNTLEFLPAMAYGKTEVGIVRRDGQEGVAEMVVVETQYLGHPAALAVLRDVTERKQAEIETRQAAEEAVDRAKDEVRLVREEAETVENTLQQAILRLEDDLKVARGEAKIVENALQKAIDKAQKETESVRQTADKAVARAEEKSALAIEKAEAAQQEAEQTTAEAKEEIKTARAEVKAARKEADAAIARAKQEARDAIAEAEQNARLAREEAEAGVKAAQAAAAEAEQAARKSAEEAAARAERSAELAREEARKVRQTADDAVARAEEAARLAREEARTVRKTAQDNIDRAEREARLAREDAEAARKALEKARAGAAEEIRLAWEESEAARKTAEQASALAEAEARKAWEEAGAARLVTESAVTSIETERQHLDPMQSELMSYVVHELRAPLHSITGFVKLLLEGGVADHATQREFLTIIADQGEHLRRLIDELVDITPAESRRIAASREPVAAAELLRGAVREAAGLARQKQIVISEEIPAELPFIEADSQRLRQVMFNLLGNAVKFSEDGGEISVKAAVSGNDLLVQVADRGCGIAEEALPRVFDKYYRGANPASAAGLGLGLYISRQIVEAHGGRIWAESAAGAGSTFSFTLPL